MTQDHAESQWPRPFHPFPLRRVVGILARVTTFPLPSDQDASGRSFGDEELDLLREALTNGTLFAPKGRQTKLLAEEFAAHLGVGHVLPCSSGSAACHTAIAALDPEPGDEIITTPITDMGALAPILFQSAIPVFADVDPVSGNVTAGTLEARISERTKGIVVTHLFGNPADMTAILAMAARHGLPVLEDCAQAYMAAHKGHLVGSMGLVGTFSLQQGKHITTGEGGLVATNDGALARRMRLFIDKAWPYGETGPNLDHEFLAPNYRISELQSAVARAQLAKLSPGVAQRIAMAERLSKQIEGLDGIGVPAAADGDTHSYWRYCLRVDASRIEGGPNGVAAKLKEFDIPSAPRYIQKPAFKCAVIADQRTFGNSRWPFTLARPEAVDYSAERFPGAWGFLEQALVLPWNERYAEEHVDRLAAAISHAATELAR